MCSRRRDCATRWFSTTKCWKTWQNRNATTKSRANRTWNTTEGGTELKNFLKLDGLQRLFVDVFVLRYEKIYDDIRATPRSLPPLKGLTSPPWPDTPTSEYPPNTDIYIETKRNTPGDHGLFKADWRVGVLSTALNNGTSFKLTLNHL